VDGTAAIEHGVLRWQDYLLLNVLWHLPLFTVKEKEAANSGWNSFLFITWDKHNKCVGATNK